MFKNLTPEEVTTPETGEEYSSFKLFYNSDPEAFSFDEGFGPGSDSAGESAVGWYWWARFPGSLPDGEPIGPFLTKQEAISDARFSPTTMPDLSLRKD